MAEPIITFEHVTFRFTGEPVVQDITFTLEKGEFLAMVGPNGGGKSTLLKLALGLLQPQGGRVQRALEWKAMGYVPQRAAAFDVQFPGTVGEIVSQGLYRGPSVSSFFQPWDTPPVREALETVGMWPYRHRRIGALSGGQQQRVLIARALVRHPQLLVLDEPTEGVDPALQEGFYALLRRLNRDQGITVFLVTHDVGVVIKEATRVACVNQRLVFHGPPSDLSDVHLSELYGVPIGLLEHGHEWGIPEREV